MAHQSTGNPAKVTYISPMVPDIKDSEPVEVKKEDDEDLSLEEALSTL